MSNFETAVGAGGRYFFWAGTPAAGEVVATTDGTPAGTVPLVVGNTAGLPPTALGTVTFGGTSYYTDGAALYRVVSSVDLKVQVAGPPAVSGTMADPRTRPGLGAVGVGAKALYLGVAVPGGSGYDLWALDATAPLGRRRVADVGPGFGELVATVGDFYYFTATSAEGVAKTLYVYDEQAGVVSAVGGGLGGVTRLHAAGGALYYLRTTAAGGVAFGRADGAAGLDLQTVAGGVATGDLTADAVGRVFFTTVKASGAATPISTLWASDGTAPGTAALRDLDAGTPAGWAAQGDRLYFTLAGSLWASDGTPAGTRPLAGRPGVAAEHSGPVAYRGRLFILAQDGQGAYGLWQLDPSGGPAAVVAAVGARATGLTVAFDRLLFGAAAAAGYAQDVWASAGGVRVARGYVTGDDVPDIVTGPGPGGGPHVKVFDGVTGAELRSFYAFAPDFGGGVFVATGDVDGDGLADLIVGAGAGGGPHVRAFSGRDGAELRSFSAFAPEFGGGVTVAAADLDSDGRAEIITAPSTSASATVTVFSGTADVVLREFATGFPGGGFVATGDLTGDGVAEIVVGAGPGGGPHVKAFSRDGTELRSDFAFAPTVTAGVRVAVADANGDGRADILAATGPGGSTGLSADGVALLDFAPFGLDFAGGIFVG